MRVGIDPTESLYHMSLIALTIKIISINVMIPIAIIGVMSYYAFVMKKATKQRARRGKPEEEKVVSFSATVIPDLLKTVEAMARMRGWSRAQTAGYLIGLGLEA